MTSNECEAEGILENTFVQAFRATPVPNAEGVDAALLRELEMRLNLEHSAPASPDEGVSVRGGQVRRTDMEEAVALLPPMERLVFLLRDVEGYGADRIARLLGQEETDVQRTLISARIRMRNGLARQKRLRESEAASSAEAGSIQGS